MTSLTAIQQQAAINELTEKGLLLGAGSTREEGLTYMLTSEGKNALLNAQAQQ